MAKRLKFSEKFLLKYEETLKRVGNFHNDESLLYIFKSFKEDISEHLNACWDYNKDDVGFNFHKGFRQADILPNIYIRKVFSKKVKEKKEIKINYEKKEDFSLDVVVWKLLQDAPEFWKVMDGFKPKRK